MLYSKAGSKSTFITVTWQAGFTSHQPVYVLKSTGQNVFFVTFNQLWVKFTAFKELSNHNYEQNVPPKDLVGKFHFSEILPTPKPLQKCLIYRTTRSCKSEYQNVFPVIYHPVVVSLELSVSLLHSLQFSPVRFALLHPQHFLCACVFRIQFILTWVKLTGITYFCPLAHSIRDWCFS